VSLAGRQKRFSNPEFDERLHRFHVLLPDEVEEFADVDEMDETSVQLLVGIEIPERVHPMSMIQVSVAAHHLPIDASNVLLKVLWEPGSLPQPFLARQTRLGKVKVRGASGNGRAGTRGIQTARKIRHG